MMIRTRGRAGTFVRSDLLDEPSSGSGTADAARAAAEDYVRTLRRLGLSSQEAARLVEIAGHQG